MTALRKMTPPEYELFISHAIPQFAQAKEENEGMTSEQALILSKDSFKALLPLGLQSANNYLFSIVEGAQDKVIGSLWFARKESDSRPHAYIYEIQLLPEARGKGHGKAAMQLLENEIKKLGLSSVSLHVFGNNTVARKLYEKLGFYVTNQVMRKDFKP